MTLPTFLIIMCAGHAMYRPYLRRIDAVDAYAFIYSRLTQLYIIYN